MTQAAAPPTIPPEVGRVVHYYEFHNDQHAGPFAGTIAKVLGTRLINVGYLSAEGHPKNATSVQLVQPGDMTPQTDYACWMAYQIGQAGKTAELQAALDAALDAAKTAELQAALDAAKPEARASEEKSPAPSAS